MVTLPWAVYRSVMVTTVGGISGRDGYCTLR
ncbi:hypothetical protein chiPu_0033544, partial [Chiloscyllium punctatum]|nr:hypothetical protein [Chiloscyllium punctatum]